MTHKELKKLADTCRKAGISSFKNDEVEFTLITAFPQAPSRNRSKKQPLVVDETQIQTEDNMSEQDILFWSSGVTQEN